MNLENRISPNPFQTVRHNQPHEQEESIMARQTKRKQAEPTTFPILKTVEQMSKISGIGENRLRQLMDNGELEYIQNGNRRLLTDEAIWDWYERMKCPAVANK